MFATYVIMFIVIFSFLQVTLALKWPLSKKDPNEEWKGKWFPVQPGQYDQNPVVNYTKKKDSHENHAKMGVPSVCDDGKYNLSMDWDNSPINFTCYTEKRLYLPNPNARPNYSCDHIPKEFRAQHKCMNTKLTYDAAIPTFGNHRPLWAQYGEYRFLPKERWLHNLEHGAIVMLYHPCAYADEVQLLRRTLTDCIYRHIITPQTMLTAERPLALVSWGCRLEMSKVDPEIVMRFIKKHFNHGPEHTSRDGQFDNELLIHSDIVSDFEDSKVCPIPIAQQM